MKSKDISEWKGDKSYVSSFYKKCDFEYKPQPNERLLVAKVGDEIVGCVRLCDEYGYKMLRTMAIHPQFRGQGIGSRLLQYFKKMLGNSECYCLPYAHLTNFYSQIGFKIIDEKDAPDFLIKRLKEYRSGKNAKEYVVMKWKTAPQDYS